MTDPRLVVFDMDGTLIDSQQVIVAAMAGAFAAAGHPMPPEAEVLAIVGLSLPEAMATLAPHLPSGETLTLVERYRDGFVAQRAAGLGEAPRPALSRRARGARAAGRAAGDADGRRHRQGPARARPCARRPRPRRFFVTPQTADTHPSKPHPSMLRAALAETGVAPDRAVMVGDTEFDIAMGRAAGVGTIGVAWGYHPRARLAAPGPTS